MTDALRGAWRERARGASEWRSGQDPEVVLDALALSVALELTGDLSRVPIQERDALRRVGQRSLLQIGDPSLDEEELEALRMCAAIARDGLRALGGRPLPDEPACDARVLIPPADLVRLLRGELDGYAAGALAMRVRRSREATAELRTLLRLEAPRERTLSLAAAGAAAVLDPGAGRKVAVHPSGVEAVLFEDDAVTRLAIYSEAPDPLRLVAPELTTEDVREGYWVGRVAGDARSVRAALHIGERVEEWELSW